MKAVHRDGAYQCDKCDFDQIPPIFPINEPIFQVKLFVYLTKVFLYNEPLLIMNIFLFSSHTYFGVEE